MRTARFWAFAFLGALLVFWQCFDWFGVARGLRRLLRRIEPRLGGRP